MATTALTIENFQSTVEDNQIVLVDFWADWCGPCKRFSPIYEEASGRHDGVVFAKVDTEDARDLAAALEIQAIPTIMGFKEGKLVYRQSGILSGKQLDSLIGELEELDVAS
ncbi:MAG: thioredoxin [Arachnia sp.]